MKKTPDIQHVTGVFRFVELTRLELATSCMPCRRAPNCAITPFTITKSTLHYFQKNFKRFFREVPKAFIFDILSKEDNSDYLMNEEADHGRPFGGAEKRKQTLYSLG